MRARAHKTDSAAIVTPRTVRPPSEPVRQSPATSSADREVVNGDVDRQSDVRRERGTAGYRFGSLAIYPKADGARTADQSARPARGGGGAGSTRSIVRRHPHHLSAVIPRVSQPVAAPGEDWSVLRRSAPVQHAAAIRRSDSERDTVSAAPTMDVGALLAMTEQGPIEGIREPEVGETISLPDIRLPRAAALVRSDKIAAAFDYNPVVVKSGVVAPNDFGHEIPSPCWLSGPSVTKTRGAFAVSATVEQLITYQVRSSVGPSGQIDIASETDPDITADNYVAVADDLKPDMTRHGRPPRAQFWAEDITIVHELFHADEDVEFVRTAVLNAQARLNRQTASNIAGVNALLAAVPAQITSEAQAANPSPDNEDRAYLNGAGLYQGRSDAIRAKGAADGYAAPAAPAPTPAPAPPAPGGGKPGGLSRGEKVGIGVSTGVIAGAAIGAAGGLIGLGIGAAIGGVAGLIGGLLA